MIWLYEEDQGFYLKQNMLINFLRISHTTVWIYSPASFPQLLSNTPHLSANPKFYVLFSWKEKKSVEFNLYWTCIRGCRVFWTIIKPPGPHTLSKLTFSPEAIVHHSSVRGNASDALMIPLHTRILTGLVLFGSKQTSPVAVNSWRLWPSGVQKALVHS